MEDRGKRRRFPLFSIEIAGRMALSRN